MTRPTREQMFAVALYVLLATVATAAAVLSFNALRDLAIVCGFAAWLAWLLPVTIDAGAGAASIVWLRRQVNAGAISYARVLALVLLALSVAGNTVDHAVAAGVVNRTWWMVVIVSAVAPAVLASLVHLLTLVARGAPATPPVDVLARARQLVTDGAGRPKLRDELGITDHQAKSLINQIRAEAPASDSPAPPDSASAATNGHAVIR